MARICVTLALPPIVLNLHLLTNARFRNSFSAADRPAICTGYFISSLLHNQLLWLGRFKIFWNLWACVTRSLSNGVLNCTLAVIIIIFVVGLLANRRGLDLRGASPTATYIPLSDETSVPSRAKCIPTPDNRSFRGNFTSSLLARFPFALEILYWGVMYFVLLAASPLGASATPSAQSHASTILALEKTLGIAIELPLQRYLLRVHPLILTLLSDVFLLHPTLGAAFLVYGYTYFPPTRYALLRRALALAPLLTLALSALWPLTPPRLTPPPTGFLDVLHPPPGYAGAATTWATTAPQRALAALPALHLAAALLLGAGTARWGRHLWLRALAPLYPALMAGAVLATASAWVLGCAAGLCAVGLGLYFNRAMLALRPLEEWVFWVCRTERPRREEDDRKAWAA